MTLSAFVTVIHGAESFVIVTPSRIRYTFPDSFSSRISIVTFSEEPVTRYIPFDVTVTTAPEVPRVVSEIVPSVPESVICASGVSCVTSL